ncbi:MAG: ATP-grasp domain-containing protein [Acidobacteriia bacterium]|nr:ATP-grasp domain-containing protein [Terriglobia bacterium]
MLLTDTARWATSARLAIGLSRAGATVSVLCPNRHPALKTRAIAETMHFSSLHPLDSLQTAIEASDPAIVIPCDDRSVEYLHELYARASLQGRDDIAALLSRSLGAVDGFPIVSSRYEFLKIAREMGLRVPETYAINALGDLEHLKGGPGFPWVMKIDGTSGGLGVEIVQTPVAAERFFWDARKLYRTARIVKRLIVNRDPFLLRPWWRRSKPAVIAQAYIQGRPANCAVVCWEGRVLAGVGVDVVSATGSTGPASVVRVVNNPEMMVAAERIARRLSLSGFFGLDFVIEEGGGETYLIEMNPRCTPLCHLRLGKGRDLIGELLAQLSGKPLQELPPVTHNDLIAYFPQAWISNSELLQSSFQDVPWGEPELSEELLRPWPNRSFVYSMHHYLWTQFQRKQPTNPREIASREVASKESSRG